MNPLGIIPFPQTLPRPVLPLAPTGFPGQKQFDRWEPQAQKASSTLFPVLAPAFTRGIGNTEDSSLISDARFQQLLPFLKEPVAVIDIGSSTAKLIILGPHQFHVSKYKLKLGESLGITRDLLGGKGFITPKAQQTFFNAIFRIQGVLNQMGIAPQNIRAVATAGLRDASNGRALIEVAHQLGLPLELISGNEEAHHAYQSVVRGIPLQRHEPALVIEIGGGSTELAFGHGPDSLEESLTATLEVGTDRLNLRDPFDWKEVLQGQEKVRQAFYNALSQKPEVSLRSIEQTAPSRRVFVEPTTIYQVLREIHLQTYGEDIFQTGLNRPIIQHYLTPAGLQAIKAALQRYQATPAPLKTKGLKNSFECIPSELIILNELFEELRLGKIEFGSSGGLKMGFLLEILEAKKAEQLQSQRVPASPFQFPLPANGNASPFREGLQV